MNPTVPYTFHREPLSWPHTPTLGSDRNPAPGPPDPTGGRSPVRVGVGGSQGPPQSGVVGTQATHVSRRIFLSATTSPVNLFLALYTTPYVPSPIFSTFWKFSMKR